MEDQSIKSLFALAERKRKAIDEANDRNSDSYRDNLAAAIATYEQCKDLAERLQLFSPNESLEDIATGDLAYV
jgi:immunoglobulin-binding protein 1